jgi:hypothetical protein
MAAACGPITLRVWVGDPDGETRAMTPAEYVAPIVRELARLERTPVTERMFAVQMPVLNPGPRKTIHR